jgi:hypothetical protein
MIMGCVEKFDPMPVTTYWMDAKKRKTHNNPKSRKQEWFNAVFEEAETRKFHTQIIQF